MLILGIESSCDETACAIVKNGCHILSNVVVSQIDIFKAYGGVIPEVAARSHLEAILPVIHKALDDAFPHLSETEQWQKIDAIAVTHTPGLLGSLLIGTLTARTLAILHQKPFYPIHHLKSHIYATWLTETTEPPAFPILSLVISGGHTQIIRMDKHNHFQIIGTTRDDAVGECFDKVAKILGLPYPGGPSISSAALGQITLQDGTTLKTTPGDRHKYHFPHPKLTSAPRTPSTSSTPSLDFSFSGLKTAVLRAIQAELNLPISFPSHQLPQTIQNQTNPARFIANFSASFEQTAIDILLENLQQAIRQYPDTQSIIFAGGVSANQFLRQQAKHQLPHHPTIFFPKKSFSGDNAAMVASAAYYEITNNVSPSDPYSLTLLPRSPISQ